MFTFRKQLGKFIMRTSPDIILISVCLNFLHMCL